MIEVFQLPAFNDNYLYVLNCEGKILVIDPGDANVMDQFLTEKSFTIDAILCTHHHPDHIGGNIYLKKKYNCPIYGFSQDRSRISGLTHPLEAGEEFYIGSQKIEVLFLPGHTTGHIAYWFESENILFSGDVLFSSGCGRLFEGSPQQMFATMNRLKQLPPETKIYCAHEYTLDNIEFALSWEPDNEMLQKKQQWAMDQRQKKQPTVPTSLEIELATNPFLRCQTVEEFAKARKAKDSF